MPNHVLQLDCTGGNGDVEADSGGFTLDEFWVEFDVAFNAAAITAMQALSDASTTVFGGDHSSAYVETQSGSLNWQAEAAAPFTPASPITANQFYHVKLHQLSGSPGTFEMWIDGVLIGTDTSEFIATGRRYFDLYEGLTDAGSLFYYDNFIWGTTDGASDLGADDFEGGDLSFWTGGVTDASIIEDPGIAAAGSGGGGGGVAGRVLIAFDDGPLEPSPTWTRIDGGDDPFPQNFVSGYDVSSGRQTLISQTNTGTAIVYINDHVTALFDPRNVSSPYFGKLDGRQILLRLYDPIAAAWEDQFRGLINDITWDIDGSAVGADGFPINASIQIECVDMFDYLAGFGLTPGLAGVTPPAGGEDGVWYAEGHVDDRMIEVLTDANIDSAMYGSPSLASGNVRTQIVKYDPDESALQALRDAADAEFPFLCNMYCDRHGKFQARGRYGRFDPDDVSAEAGSDWDFTRWAAGDGAAIVINPDRAQLRTFAFGRNRSDLINVAISYPQGMAAVHMPDQVYADSTSILAYGKHDAPPMSDLLTADTGMTSGSANGREECFKYAKLLVLNQKDPRENVTLLGFKSIRPDGTTRSQKTWALITKADISHIVNVAVGYPSGTGLTGATPDDDYYIEGRRLRVRPLNPQHDYVELDLDVSPAVWSMDMNGVFPDFASVASSETPTLTAAFAYA